MSDVTPRLELPLLQPGQAQKEMTHNEALARIDMALGASVQGVGGNVPPPAPMPGDCWIVGPAPVDAWAGQADALAAWTAGGWRFVAPRDGLTAWHVAAAMPLRYADGTWHEGALRGTSLTMDGVQVIGRQAPAIADPAGGDLADDSARAAIAEILAALRGHGLVAR